MSDELFTDRFGDISLSGSTVRIDLVSQSPTEKDAEGQPAMRFRQRNIMPVEGFVRSFEMMQRMMDILIERGVVRKDVPVPAAEQIIEARPTVVSPNFATA